MDSGMDNYYILLELPFDPPANDTAAIKTALHKKKQEWTRWQDNPGKRGLGLKYLDMAPDILEALLDPVQRARQATEALELRQSMLRQFEAELRILEVKGCLLPKEVTAIALKYKAYGIDKHTVQAYARVPIGDAPPPPVAPKEQGDIIDRLTARAIQRNLTVLGTQDLYSFLEEQPYSSIKKLRVAAQNKRRAAQQNASKNAAATAAQELAGICLQIFESFDTKQRYDRYLKVSKYPALGEMIDQERDRSQYISPAILLRLVNFGVEKYRIGVLEAEEYIRGYCAAYSILVDTSAPTIQCPACSAKAPSQSAACPSCGAPLRGECPSCGAEFSEGPPVCGDCGFALADMGKAIRYIDDAQSAIIENNWSTAQRNVQYAKKYWPNHPQIMPLEKRARSLEDRYAQYVDNISDCVRHNQYYAALDLVEEAEARRIRLPASCTGQVRRVVEALEAKIAALTADGAQPPIEAVLELSATVGDSLELSRMMKKQPPREPVSLEAAVKGDRVFLTWKPSPSPGLLDYVIVRKKGGLPLTAFDGDVLYEGPASSYEDKQPPKLVECYYSVFTVRSGAYSGKGSSTGPLLIAPELRGLSVMPADQSVRLTWDFNPDIKDVIIWRKLGGGRPIGPGEGIRLENSRVDGFTDIKIKNDVEYWYYLVAAYQADDKTVYSPGVCERVTPHKFQAPVERLAIVKSNGDEDEYVVNWQGAPHRDILLLVSPRKPEFKPGEIMQVQELLTRYRRVELQMRGADSAVFRHTFNGGVYVFAAALFGKFASVGQYSYLTNVRNVENLTCDIIGGEIFLNMKWPPGLQEVAVAYRFDRFPGSLEEIGTTVVYTTREQYDYDAGVLFREPEQVCYYVKVYSVFRTPDGQALYSDGVELMVDNTAQREVFYQMQYKRKLFAGSGSVSLTISAADNFLLPKAVLVGKIGRLPLNKSDGMPLFEVEKETKVAGQITYQYQTADLPKELYIRLFLRDDELYSQYYLLPLGNPKIT